MPSFSSVRRTDKWDCSAAKNGKDHYGKNDDDVLAVRGTTMQFNPVI
jgi:hypothetical protein